MAVRLATSDPKPSSRNPGYWFFYYNRKTDKGTDCLALIPDALRGIVKENFCFDDSAIRWSEELGASVLVLDFDEPAQESEPALPAHHEAGWRDPDHFTAAIGSGSDPAALAAVLERQAELTGHAIPNKGVRPATARKQDAAARAAEHNIPVDLLTINEQVCRTFNYISARIGSGEKPGAVIAQKLTAIAYIAYSNKVGINLSDDDKDTLLNT